MIYIQENELRMMSFLLDFFHNTLIKKVFAIFTFCSLLIININAQTPATAFTTTTQAATASTVGAETWGNGDDVYLETATFFGNVYNVDAIPASFSFVREDNTISSGVRCRLFAESDNVSTSTTHHPTLPVDGNGNASMETALKEHIINRGALDVFHNVNSGVQYANNIERVDIIFDSPMIAPSDPVLLAEIGFLASEKAGNNEYKGAAITSIDSNGSPLSYGPLAYIDGTSADYGTPQANVNFRFLENAPNAPHGDVAAYGGTPELIGLTLLTFQDLGVNAEDMIYGISFFGKDVTGVAPQSLIDPSTFPKTTSEGADIHGGLGSLLSTSNVDAEALLIVDPCNPATSGNIDTDNDGISDVCDLDDDNDGILDHVECDLPTGTTPSSSAFSWVNDNRGIETTTFVGSVNNTGDGYQQSGFEQFVYGKALDVMHLNTANDFTFTGTGNSTVTTFDNGTVNYDSSLAPGINLNVTNTTSSGVVSGTSGDGIRMIVSATGMTTDNYMSANIDFTDPVEAFSFDVTDLFDNTPTSLELKLEIFINGTIVAYIDGNFVGSDLVGSVDLFDGSAALQGQLAIGNNLENSFGFYSQHGIDNVEIRYTIISGTATQTEQIGIDAFTYSMACSKDTDLDGTPDRIDTDSDNDGCSDANEAYGDPNADGGNGEQYGIGTPVPTNPDGTVIAAAYDTGVVAAVTDDDDTASVCYIDPCDPAASGNADTDTDGIADICDDDDDNDGILDTVEDAQCSNGTPSNSGIWTASGSGATTTWFATAGTVGITASATNYGVGTTYPLNDFITTDSMACTGAYSEPSIVENPSLSIRHTFHTDGNINGTPSTAQITFDFSEYISNPVIHFDRLGGGGAPGDLTTSSFVKISTPNIAFSELGENDIQFLVTPNSVTRNAGIHYSASPSECGPPTNGTAAGSVRINGVFKTITFEISMNQNGNANVNDRWEIAFSDVVKISDCDGDGIPNSLDPDSDDDGCSDANEAYGSTNADGGDGSQYGTGTPAAINPDGTVTAASYNATAGNEIIPSQIYIIESPFSQVIAEGSPTTFAIEATAATTSDYYAAPNADPDYTGSTPTSAGLNYQWYLGTPNPGVNELSNTGVYSGTDSNTLAISDVTGLNGNDYYVVVTHDSNICNTSLRNATLEVVDPCSVGSRSFSASVDSLFSLIGNLKVPTFDESLGNLTEIRVEAMLSTENFRGTGAAESLNNTAETVNLTKNLDYNISTIGNTILSDTDVILNNNSIELDSFDNTIDFDGLSGETILDNLLYDKGILTLSSAADIATFTSNGLDSIVVADFNSVVVSSASGTGNIISSFATAFDMDVNVTYIYTPVASCITIAENDINQTPQDIVVSGNVLTNDTDPDGDNQTVQSATYLNASGIVTNLPFGTDTNIYDGTTLAGSINLNTDGTYDFTPAADYTGTVPVSYVVVDDSNILATDAATLSIEVIENPITKNHKNNIIAQDDTNTTEQGETVSSNVLSNDNDPDNLLINLHEATASDGSGGLVSLDANPKDIYDANNVLAGQAHIDVANNIVFTAAADFEGEVVIDYTIQGSSLTFDDAILTITVEPFYAGDNDTYANDDAGTGFQKETIIGNILANDYDPENDTQTVSTAVSSDGTAITPGAITSTDLAGIGTLEIGTDGAYTFIPEPDFVGTETIVYTVCDDESPVACETATLYLTSLPTNFTIAENDINQTPLNTVANGNVLTNDTDAEGDIQTVQSASHLNASGTVVSMILNTATDLYDFDGTLAGSIILDTDGSYEFTPATGYVGTAPMEYTVEDDNDIQATNSGFLTIEVLPAPTTDGSNNTVVAQDDTNIVEPGETVTSIILANDSDPDGDAISVTTATASDGAGGIVTLTSTPQDIYDSDDFAGQASIDANGNIIFTADTNYEDDEVQINYIATDGTSTDNATLTIIVEPFDATDNDTHTNDDANTGLQGIPLTGNILTNDYDPEGDTQTIGTILSSDGTAITAGAASPTTLTGIGTLEIGTDGSYTFVPVPSFAGTEIIEYTACDDGSPHACETSTLYLTSLPVDNSTSAIDDFNNTLYETSVLGNVSTNDYDNEGDNQTFSLNGVNGGMDIAEGSVTIAANGSYTFIPAATFAGETSFSYEVCDDAAAQACETATVYIEVLPIVTPQGQPIIANIDANTVSEGETGTGNVLSNDLDPDGGTLTVSTTTSNTVVAGTDEDGNAVPNAATLTLNTDGTYTIVSTGGFVGTISYPYTACNNETIPECDNSLLLINVIPNNGNTTFANDDATITDAGTAVNGDLSENDVDYEIGDVQTVSSYTYDDINGDPVSGTVNGSSTIGGTNENNVFVANAGTLEMSSNGTYTFTPAANFVGNAIVVYTTCDDNSTQACDVATLVITVLNANRDYSDAPASYPVAWHRGISDTNNNNVLDGSNNVWLGSSTDFETVDNTSASADGDNFDDAMTFGNGVGEFPLSVAPLENFDVTIKLNREQAADEVFYGMWIDWDNNGSYDDFYSGSAAPNGLTDVTVNITAPAGISGTEVINVRLRADDSGFIEANQGGVRTNGEVEDYQRTIVLPVELTSFIGVPSACNAQLNWVSASEEDFDRYEIQWSSDNETWRTIDVIYGQGGINTQYYQYLHDEAGKTNYYRLKMVDLDDSYEYTEVIIVITDCSDLSEFVLYPNPVFETRGNISIRFFSKVQMDETITITDMLGRLVKQMDITIYDSWNNIDADIDNLPQGSYIIRMEENDIAKMFIIAD